MNSLPGISGALFPERYLVDQLEPDAAADGMQLADVMALDRRLRRWWQEATATCGPASGVRTLFDLVAMPLCALLGFRAARATFEGQTCRVQLVTRTGATVALLLLPWASQPSSGVRDIASAAREMGTRWGFVLAPPFLSLLHLHGHASRRAIDFTLPTVMASASRTPFLILTRAAAFDTRSSDTSGIDRCAFERLLERSAAYQSAVRRDLQDGVESALSDLATSIVEVQRSRGTAPSGRHDPAAARDQALTLVYRILFLLFAESRDLVPHQDEIYRGAYAMGTLCREAIAGAERGLWEALAATTRLARLGCRSSTLTVTPFNGPLFARSSAPDLERRSPAARPTAADLARAPSTRRALIALGSRPGRGGRETINFRDLGVEQLGAIYERVLDVNGPASAATRRKGTGHRHSRIRRETGTFYTPQSLTEFLVAATLSPLVRGAPPEAILALRVVDPAMGSGAFLVAACRYLATSYEQALIDEGRASATDFDDAERARLRRLVATQCLAGVDRNATAVQLARLSLWLTTLARDKPLTFLDHRLRVGDSLTGGWPVDLDHLSGRGRRPAAALPLFGPADIERAMGRSARPLFDMLGRHDDSVADVRAKEAAWRYLSGDGSPLSPWRAALNLWCARWFWPDESPPDAAETRALTAALLHGDRSLPAAHLAARMRLVSSIALDHRLFHWPLEFADVFYDEHGRQKATPGFDAVVGNPPWEMLRADGDDTSASRVAAHARRRFLRFIRECGGYPSCDRGHLNLYQPFVERALTLVRAGGRIGLVLPWGLAADDGAAGLRRRLLEDTALERLLGFDNTHGLFPIHRSMRFSAVIATAGGRTRDTEAAIGIRTAEDLDALAGGEDRTARVGRVRITPGQVEIISGPMRRFPAVRHARDLAWLEHVSRVAPRLGDANGWHVTFGRELNATEAAGDFSRHGLPVLDGKHLSPFHADVAGTVHRIEPARAVRRVPGRGFERPRLAYRDVSGTTNRLTLIAAIVPAGVVTTHTVFCLKSPPAGDQQRFLCALLNSYVLNAVARMLMGGHLTTTLVEALPAPVWRETQSVALIVRLTRRLEAKPHSRLAAARLQALVAQLYELSPKEFRRILQTFPLVPEADRERAARLLDGYAGAARANDDELIG